MRHALSIAPLRDIHESGVVTMTYDRGMRAARLALAMLVVAWALAGCSAIPSLEQGSGCNNATGIGPIPAPGAPMIDGPNDPAIETQLIGKPPGVAAAIARARGHTVVFNVQIPGYGECWCETPPEGTVSSAWFNAHGALFLGVDGVDVGHTANDQPSGGWGC
jgi:hypothetical protein